MYSILYIQSAEYIVQEARARCTLLHTGKMSGRTLKPSSTAGVLVRLSSYCAPLVFPTILSRSMLFQTSLLSRQIHGILPNPVLIKMMMNIINQIVE